MTGNEFSKRLYELGQKRRGLEARAADASEWDALANEYEQINAYTNAQDCREHADWYRAAVDEPSIV